MKKKILNIILIVIIVMIVSITTAYATNYLYNSNEVYYDNTNSNITSSDVQGAIDELYTEATNYSSINTRLSMIEASHNSIYRGKDITSYYTDGSLYTRISSGEFTDLYVGDYIVKNGVNWRIAGFDIYYGKGDQGNGHHAVIVPDTSLTDARMNSSDTTEGGYVGSEMYTTTLPSVLSTYITPVFSSHVLEYRNMLTTSVSNGASNNWAWQTRKLDLMNENQVYGSIVWSSSGYETGSDNIQFPLFRLKPEFINKQRSNYWLRNVATASAFADVSGAGLSDIKYASRSLGVRPYFYID